MQREGEVKRVIEAWQHFKTWQVLNVEGKNDYRAVFRGAGLYVNLYVNSHNDNRRRIGLAGQF